MNLFSTVYRSVITKLKLPTGNIYFRQRFESKTLFIFTHLNTKSKINKIKIFEDVNIL